MRLVSLADSKWEIDGDNVVDMPFAAFIGFTRFVRGDRYEKWSSFCEASRWYQEEHRNALLPFISRKSIPRTSAFARWRNVER